MISSRTRTLAIVTAIVKQPKDWIGARQRAQIIADCLGFSSQDQTRIATAVSEIARNALEYAGGGRVEFVADTTGPQSLLIRVSDEGPGIRDLELILSGQYRSEHGLGIGITGSRTLMDDFVVDTRLGIGTSVELRKYLPKSAPQVTPQVLATVSEALSRRPSDPLEEAHHFNQELLRTLDELNRVNRELKAANEAKDLFLATVSHEMRTPMTAILGWLQMLESPSLDAAARSEGISAIRSAARVQARLVDDVLDAARVHTGKMHLDVSDLDVREVIDSMWSAVQPAIAAKSLVLDKSFSDDPLLVRGDLTRLQQIIWNLVTNAIKFTPEKGTITLCASSDGESVSIKVTDTGEGISAELLPHVFDRFQQGADARKHGGLGLGLAIVHHLVELHGGSITAASAGAGQGACFTVLFPVSLPAAVPA
ncbi:MAG TPA: ATP-binding protein [Thermoanaerobaculia bacterium]|nr:ATP-binding protein [Thermoanaerobaculia bacterium]